ncbi:MAG: hypothetical protein MRK00_04480 [Nitrosomonas sp.]|nr:hypothetical protein [Nitrosomonas sp.]
MQRFLLVLFMGLGYLLQVGGGFFLAGVFFYGIYILFFKSITIGLMAIGGAVVGGWIVQLVSNLLFAVGMGVATIGFKEE